MRNEGISESIYMENIIRSYKEPVEYSPFNDELTKFTQKSNKKVTFSDFPSNNSSFLFNKMPLTENVY